LPRPWVTVVPDAIFMVVMALMLQRSRSRCVALVIAGHATFITLLTFAARAGLYQGDGRILALIVTVFAYRAVYATVVYQRLRNIRPDWRGTLILTLIAAAMTVVVAVVVFVIGAFNDYNFDDDSPARIALVRAIWAMWLLVFNRILPFTGGLRVVTSDGPRASGPHAGPPAARPASEPPQRHLSAHRAPYTAGHAVQRSR
jgi:hypothetical protein